MTLSETKKILAVLRAAYPNFYKDIDPGSVVNVWHMALEDFEYPQVSAACKTVIRSLKFAPTPADLIDAITLPAELNSLSAADAWELVRKAISNGNYSAREEFDALPPIVQIVVGSPRTIEEWAAMDYDKTETITYSNFKKDYMAVIQRQRDFLRLPGSVRRELSGQHLDALTASHTV